ncbi:YbfB/YjiJ family MFS transporter [Salinisphaera aquimarina]|uniref:YbfB/YjiJ family MFS transporter n=1 Tax=Salinisphaera aquimarina TaxID=2094031 RepID=A0ABV7EMD6_9GAMM
MSKAPPASTWRLSLAGAVALLLGVGLGRYAFTPLITPLVQQGWFTPQATAQLGAINLLGYLLGAASADRSGRLLGERRAIALCLTTLTLSLFGCMFDAGFVWYGLWRLLAGWSAATLTIVVTPAIMARVPAARRPAASAIIFTGIGVGTITASLIVPWLAAAGIAATWAAIGSVAALLGAWSWFAVWRDLAALPATTHSDQRANGAPVPWLAIALIVLAYGLNSAGYVPHSLYWVDYIARELGRGLAAGNGYWLVLGVGGMLGPAAGGLAAQRLGFRSALVAAFVLMTTATALPLLSSTSVALGLSSLLVGAMVPAIITLTAGAVVELSPPGRQRQIWGWATLSFALMQTIGGFAMAQLYAQVGSYRDTIAAGAVILVLGTLCVSVGAAQRRR